MNATRLEGQQPSNQIKQYCHCLLYVTESQHRYKQLNVSAETEAVSQRMERPRHSPVGRRGHRSTAGRRWSCAACRRRLAGAWPRASCFIVAIETSRIHEKIPTVWTLCSFRTAYAGGFASEVNGEHESDCGVRSVLNSRRWHRRRY